MANGRSALSLALLASLSACNMVVAEKPWFDTPSGPQLRDGLWANINSADCMVGADQPIADWPSCAKPMLVRGGEYLGPGGESADLPPEQRNDPAKWDVIAHVLVDGNPQVDQIRLASPPDEAGAAQGGAGAPAALGLKPGQDLYLFMVVRPLKRDSQGRILETRRLPVLCGPMPKEPRKAAANGSMDAFVTAKPFKGLVVKDGACTAVSAEALMAAAAQSEAIAGPSGFSEITSRWVRDTAN